MQSPEYVIDLNEQNFRETLEKSMKTPVLIHFWAPSFAESAEIIPQLKTLAQHYQGAMTLALLNCEEQQALAGQFGVQTLPTIALFINGQPAGGLAGPQPLEKITAMLAEHLPSQDELAVRQALQLIENGEHAKALPLLTQLADEFKAKGEVKLALADCYLETKQFEEAKQQLEHIPLEYQDNYYKGLMAKLELHQQAAESPELKRLEQEYQSAPDNLALACDLAIAYHEAGRDEEALTLLWQPLSKDLNAHDGEVKKSFMDIISALGQGNPLAAKYRRQLYSLLY